MTYPGPPPLLQWVHPTCHQCQPVPLPLLFETNFTPIPDSLCPVLYPCSPCPVQFSSLVVSDSLRPHGRQHTGPACPSPTPGVYPNSCPLSRWCHPAISSSFVPFSSCPQSFPASGSFATSQLCFRWPKYWGFSFNISPSNKQPGLISIRMDWLDLLEFSLSTHL